MAATDYPSIGDYALIGVPPMQYLTRWRTSLAASRLRESDVSIMRVATDVGYESEAAFNRAFKREFGLPPAAWRKQTARAGATPDPVKGTQLV